MEQHDEKNADTNAKDQAKIDNLTYRVKKLQEEADKLDAALEEKHQKLYGKTSVHRGLGN